MDRYFTSVPLAKWASENSFAIVGTTRLDLIGLPNKIKTMEWREGKSTKYLYQKDGDVFLVSYVDKKKKCCPCYERWAKETSCSYDLWSHKRGVDVVDLISSHQSTCFKSPRWPVNVLAFFAWHYLNKFKSSTHRIFKTWCYVNIWIYFSSWKTACCSSHTVSLWKY